MESTQTLLALKHEDVYGELEARAIVATLYDEYRRNPLAFQALGLADVLLTLEDGVHVRFLEHRQERRKPVSAIEFDRLVALVDALHSPGDLRIVFTRAGEEAARAALEEYAYRGQTAAPRPSALLTRHTSDAAAAINGVSPEAAAFCHTSLRRIRDVYALSALLPDHDRPILDMTMAVLLETSHRVDDYYDNDAKWHTYGYENPGEAIAEGMVTVEQLLAGKAYQGEAIAQAKSLLDYLEDWVSGDSRVSDLGLVDSTQRVFECNGDLYRRFFDIYSLGTAASRQLMSVFEAFGALIWVLDDWRDVEADALNDHFNVFTPVRMDVRLQVEQLANYFEILLEKPLRILGEERIEEMLCSAGTTDVMKRHLGLGR